MNKINSPILRYLGGKWRIAPWIISQFPPHKYYVELFGGAASVLLRKPVSVGEVYNDLNDELVNLFKVVRDKKLCEKLIEFIEWTPYAKRELEEAFLLSADPVEKARRLIIRSFMGVGTKGVTGYGKTGFNAKCYEKCIPTGPSWENYPYQLRFIRERLKNVIIEQSDALRLIELQDSSDTLFYADPPYVPTARRDPEGASYAYELSTDDHELLLNKLIKAKGMAIISGYDNYLYNDLLGGWIKKTKNTKNQVHNECTEVIWIKPYEKYNQKKQMILFS